MMLQLNHYVYIFANFATYKINMVMPSKMTINVQHRDIFQKKISLNEHLLQLVVDKDCGFPFDEA